MQSMGSLTLATIWVTPMATIPHCDELFQRFFAPWYSADELSNRGFKGTRPDILEFPNHIGKSAAELSPLREEVQTRFVQHLAKTMTDAAIGDFGSLLSLSPPVDFDWIKKIDEYFNVERIAELIEVSDPAENGNTYFILCIELGTLIAQTMQTLVPDLQWMPDSPYWESALWHPPSGFLIPPTHWAINKFSDDGWNDGLVPKIHCGLQSLIAINDAE